MFNATLKYLLLDARAQAAKYGVTHKSIVHALQTRASDAQDPSAYVRQHYQMEAYRQLLKFGQHRIDAVERHRSKQKRWKLNIPLGISSTRAVSLFKRLGRLVMPRVLASVPELIGTDGALADGSSCKAAVSSNAAAQLATRSSIILFVKFSKTWLHVF